MTSVKPCKITFWAQQPVSDHIKSSLFVVFFFFKSKEDHPMFIEQGLVHHKSLGNENIVSHGIRSLASHELSKH